MHDPAARWDIKEHGKLAVVTRIARSRSSLKSGEVDVVVHPRDVSGSAQWRFHKGTHPLCDETRRAAKAEDETDWLNNGQRRWRWTRNPERAAYTTEVLVQGISNLLSQYPTLFYALAPILVLFRNFCRLVHALTPALKFEIVIWKSWDWYTTVHESIQTFTHNITNNTKFTNVLCAVMLYETFWIFFSAVNNCVDVYLFIKYSKMQHCIEFNTVIHENKENV